MSVGFVRRKRPPMQTDNEPAVLPVGATAALPTGPIKSPHPISGRPFGFDWSRITRWQPAMAAAQGKYPRVRDEWLGAIVAIESNGSHYVNDDPQRGVVSRPNGAHRSVGLTQITIPLWAGLDPSADAMTPAGNVMLAAAFIDRHLDENGGDVGRTLVNDYFPADDPNGTTRAGYLKSFTALVNEWNGAADEPAPPKPPVVDPVRAVVGDVAFDDDYGWLADRGLDFYGYGVGHGTTRSTQHPAVDAMIPVGTPLYAPAGGVVRCVGGNGSPDWGQACGAYADAQGGVGNITIMLDVPRQGVAQVKLTLGHCRSASVKPGDRVRAGQVVGASGFFNGAHVHVETSVYDATRPDGLPYLLVEPRGALAPYVGPMPGPAYKEWTIPGLAVPILLPEDIPVNTYLTRVGPNRSQRFMPVKGIVSHETGNPNMGALGHARWQDEGTPGHPDGYIGVHAYIDEFGIWITLPFNEQGVHAGDARNQTMLGFERCVNDKGKASVRNVSERYTQELEAAVLRALGMTAAQNLVPHTSRGCPAQTNARGTWPQWVQIVDGKRGGAISPPAKRFPGLPTIPDAVILDAFPFADPSGKGIVTKAWIAACAEDRALRSFLGKTEDAGAVWWRFDGGLLLRSKDGAVERVRP